MRHIVSKKIDHRNIAFFKMSPDWPLRVRPILRWVRCFWKKEINHRQLHIIIRLHV